MIKAYHYTSQENFDAIRRDGFIRPRTEKRKFGEQGAGFSTDWHAQDNQFVFFSPEKTFYASLVGEDRYGFVFDAEFLILGLGSFVGPDLLTKYDDLMHECAKAVAKELGPKPIDEAGLQAFLEKHQIADEKMIASMRADEQSHYYNILYGMLDTDESVAGAVEGLTMFRAKVGAIQQEYRVSGDAALDLLRSGTSPIGTPLEILVPSAVPINAQLGDINPSKSRIP